MKILLLTIILIPLFTNGQELSSTRSIDSTIEIIENDPSIIKKVYDSVWYQKEDGGENGDSLYNHREVFYKNGQIVKIRVWNKYGNWRNDMLAYYHNDKTISFSKGEGFEIHEHYGKLNFQIYYYHDKYILITWLTPKPDNVIGLGTEAFLEWAYSLQKNAR